MRRHFRPWRKRELAGDNNSLAGFHAALNHDKIAVLALTWFHRPKFNSVVRLYHKNKRPTLANLDGLRRHKRGVLERVQNETDKDKFRRPQRAISIRRDSADFHRSRAGLHCVIDKIQIAHARGDRPVCQVCFHFHVWAAEIFSHKRQIVLGHGEVGVNRIQTLDCDEWRSRGSNQVANVNIAETDSSVNGRLDVAIIEVHLGSLRRCLRLLCIRHSSVVVLLRYDLSRAKIFLSLQRHLV